MLHLLVFLEEMLEKGSVVKCSLLIYSSDLHRVDAYRTCPYCFTEISVGVIFVFECHVLVWFLVLEHKFSFLDYLEVVFCAESIFSK